MDVQTTREKIGSRIRTAAATPSELGTEFGISRGAVFRHVRHVAKSVDTESEQFLVRPPRCRECGFEAFDDPLNYPTRCPECKSEAIEEPAFRIDPVSG